MPENEKLLKEIRDRRKYHIDYWKPIWDEGDLDMKYASGDPWDEVERANRKANGNQPCLVFDELQQHINQTVNELRMNKLAVKISPEGGGAEQKHAELRQGRIRKIEYDSRAQTAYLTAYESMITQSYGYFGLLLEYCDDCGFDQKLKVRRFQNSKAVSLDPDAKEAAAADMMDAFVIDTMPKATFRKRWPKATIQDFDATHMTLAPQWISEETIQVGECWKVEIGSRNLLMLEGFGKIFEDELEKRGMAIDGSDVVMPDGGLLPILMNREVETRTVKQYITNGVEILRETEWLGSWIPIFPMFGKELFVNKGSGSKRILLSRVRMARDPFMFYCYVRSTQAALIRMTPKVPYLGVKGQFDTTTEWDKINDIPTAFAEYNAVTQETGSTILPKPERQSYEPAIAALEMAAEAAKRAIQSAFGSYNASIGKEDTHARSGVAIKSLQAQSSQGTYHFVDSDVVALEQAGRCMNELLDKIEGTPRDVGIINPDETAETVHINEKMMKDGKEQYNTYGEGNYGVVVSTGPSYQTQREEASAFLDNLLANLQALPVAPEVKSKLISLAIRMKSLGPFGDEMATLLDPSQGDMPPHALAKLQEAGQLIQAMQQQLAALNEERQSKILELESKEKIAAIQADVDKTKIRADFEIKTATLASNEGIEELRQEFQKLQMQIEQLRAVEQPIQSGVVS